MKPHVKLSPREKIQFEAERIALQQEAESPVNEIAIDVLSIGMALFHYYPEEDALSRVASCILSCFGLEHETERFLSSGDGLALLANCCNAAAKWYDNDFYQFKPYLIRLATQYCDECWQNAGIVYIETCVGQVSFHALCGEDQGLPEANGRVWSGLEYQWNAPMVARAFLDGWSKESLQQTIYYLDEEVA